jgi:imidazole glycerol-phosphate synthase subunit HisF
VTTLRPRIIPCLLVHQGGLVKTRAFGDPKYVGDPINAVRIFNEKEVDELIVADIDASVHRREPDYKLIAQLAAECRMPLCYAGGVNTPEQVERIIGLGVEKVAISSAAIERPALITAAAERLGSQSIVVVMDVKKARFTGRYELYTHNGKRAAGVDPVTFAKRAQNAGAGEIVVNSIDRDGEMKGYDLELADKVRNAITLPLTILGGAGSFEDIAALVRRFGVIGAAAGSVFVFKGKYRAVLINYPTRAAKDLLGLSTATV